MKRRSFIKSSALASTTLWVPSFLQEPIFGKLQNSRSGKILVVVQLSGGNDGLNTIVPFENDLYYQSRPSLAIKREEVLRLNDEQGVNPALEGLKELYDGGRLNIINSVGYPNPDRSHFRSMDIWHTASGSEEYLSTGWVGRYLDSTCEGCQKPYHAIEIDDSLSLAMKGTERRGFAMSDPKQLKRVNDNRFLKAVSDHHGHHHDEEPVAYLYKTMIETQSSADYLYEQSRVHRSTVDYPGSLFARDLKRVAELITADTDTRVYYVSMTGFDTHANQKGRQSGLLKQYGDAMRAFVKDLEANGLLNDTLIMTFSEFGRRVKQNGSNGTDHGTANNLFLIGGDLKQPGIFNAAPDLGKLDQGDLIYQVDFRNVYATLLEQWLDTDPKKILGSHFEPMSIL